MSFARKAEEAIKTDDRTLAGIYATLAVADAIRELAGDTHAVADAQRTIAREIDSVSQAIDHLGAR